MYLIPGMSVSKAPIQVRFAPDSRAATTARCTLLSKVPRPLMRCRRLEEASHLFEILRRIHADRVVARFHRLDANTVLERAQLLERLGSFERRLFQRRQHQ